MAERLATEKATIVVAAEVDGRGMGRIRMRRIPGLKRETLHGFSAEAAEPGSTVRADGPPADMDMIEYIHDRQVQRRQPKGREHLPPGDGWRRKWDAARRLGVVPAGGMEARGTECVETSN